MSAINSSMCRFIYYFQKGVRHCWTMLDPAIECKWMQITFAIIYILFDKCCIGIKLGSFCRLWVAKQLSQTQGRKFKALNENSIVALFDALSSPARIRESWGNGQWNHKIRAWGHKYGVLDNGLASWYSNKIAAAKRRNMDGAKTWHLPDFGTIWINLVRYVCGRMAIVSSVTQPLRPYVPHLGKIYKASGWGLNCQTCGSIARQSPARA